MKINYEELYLTALEAALDAPNNEVQLRIYRQDGQSITVGFFGDDIQGHPEFLRAIVDDAIEDHWGKLEIRAV